MRRRLILLMFAAILLATMLREPAPSANTSRRLDAAPITLPPTAVRDAHLGPFRLEAAWLLTSPNSTFGSYSALVPLEENRMRAISDHGALLDFTVPGAPPQHARFDRVLHDRTAERDTRDAEAATRDPATGTIWIAWEGRNAITRHDSAMAMQAMVFPPAMRGWPVNKGPEAMTRLADGRFVILGECYESLLENRLHPGLLFMGEPNVLSRPVHFSFAGSPGYRPTDMAQLPDGRVLVLMRNMVWPMPARFSIRILIADPAGIRSGGIWQGHELARLDSPLPVDNFEGMAITPGPGDQLTVWLISDDNDAVTQRSLLWKLILDPSKIDTAKQKARRNPARPSAKSVQPARGPKG